MAGRELCRICGVEGNEPHDNALHEAYRSGSSDPLRPIAAMAKAALEGRVYLTGKNWVDDDGQQSWSCEVGVSEPLASVQVLTDKQAMDSLLAEWNTHEDGWNGADAVDFIGSLLGATGRDVGE